MARILVVEDDAEIADTVEIILTSDRHTVEVCGDGAIASSMLKQLVYDLVILDWRLPNRTGYELCLEYRAAGGNASVLFLTSEKDISSKEKGFQAGADDYLVKPFHPLELRSRVKALLRRPAQYAGSSLVSGDLVMDLDQYTVFVLKQEIKLRPLEFALLEFFLRHKNQVFSAEALLMNVWPPNSEGTEESVKTYVKTLRKKLQVEGNVPTLSNLHGIGYKIQD